MDCLKIVNLVNKNIPIGCASLSKSSGTCTNNIILIFYFILFPPLKFQFLSSKIKSNYILFQWLHYSFFLRFVRHNFYLYLFFCFPKRKTIFAVLVRYYGENLKHFKKSVKKLLESNFKFLKAKIASHKL